MQIQLVDDHLTERKEWFGIQLSSASPLVNVIDTQLLLYIEPSDGMCVVNHTLIVIEMLEFEDIAYKSHMI